MRAILAASIGSLCTAALMVPLASPAAAHLPTVVEIPSAGSAPASSGVSSGDERSPSTRSLPLTTRAEDSRSPRAGRTPTKSEAVGLAAREVSPFSMIGVVWDDATEELHAEVEVRTRASGTTDWSRWTELENHTDDAPDQNSEERTNRQIRGSTAPMWVGDSDAVEVRLHPETGSNAHPLPNGLRVALIDPGTDDAPDNAAGAAGTARPAGSTAPATATDATMDGKPASRPAPSPQAAASSAVNAQLAGMGADMITPLSRKETQAEFSANKGQAASAEAAAPIGPRPGIVTRAGWKANESWREKGFGYTTTVKSAFVHHTAASNNYTCAQAPSVIRGIYQYHVQSLGWRDIGYNFLVDKCGTIYEGRAGGVAKAVLGAHTYGFNSNTTGIAVLGSYGSTAPPKAAVDGVSKLVAWKLGLHGLNPVGSVTLTSGGGKYPAGTKVNMKAVAGHRDGFATECPGAQLYKSLGTVRSQAARLQGR